MADTLAWAVVVDTSAADGEAAGLAWAGPVADGVVVGAEVGVVAGSIPALLVEVCWAEACGAVRGDGVEVGDRVGVEVGDRDGDRPSTMTGIMTTVRPSLQPSFKSMAATSRIANGGSDHTTCVPEPIWAATADAIDAPKGKRPPTMSAFPRSGASHRSFSFVFHRAVRAPVRRAS